MTVGELIVHVGRKRGDDPDDQGVPGGQPLGGVEGDVEVMLDDRQRGDHHRLAGEADEGREQEDDGDQAPRMVANLNSLRL